MKKWLFLLTLSAVIVGAAILGSPGCGSNPTTAPTTNTASPSTLGSASDLVGKTFIYLDHDGVTLAARFDAIEAIGEDQIKTMARIDGNDNILVFTFNADALIQAAATNKLVVVQPTAEAGAIADKQVDASGPPVPMGKIEPGTYDSKHVDASLIVGAQFGDDTKLTARIDGNQQLVGHVTTISLQGHDLATFYNHTPTAYDASK